jgi:hypothetical protein
VSFVPTLVGATTLSLQGGLAPSGREAGNWSAEPNGVRSRLEGCQLSQRARAYDVWCVDVNVNMASRHRLGTYTAWTAVRADS